MSAPNLEINSFLAYLVCINKVNKKEKIFGNTIFDYSQLTKLFSCCVSDLAALGISLARTTNNMVCSERVWKYFEVQYFMVTLEEMGTSGYFFCCEAAAM